MITIFLDAITETITVLDNHDNSVSWRGHKNITLSFKNDNSETVSLLDHPDDNFVITKTITLFATQAALRPTSAARRNLATTNTQRTAGWLHATSFFILRYYLVFRFGKFLTVFGAVRILRNTILGSLDTVLFEIVLSFYFEIFPL